MANAHVTPQHPMGKAALAYALGTALCLFFLGRLETPYAVYAAGSPGRLLLGTDPLEGLLNGLGIGAGLTLLGEILTRFTRWGRMIFRVMKRIVGNLHPADALLLAALSSVAEELIFRGIALPYFGLLASSAVFGAAHLVPRKGLWVWSLWAGGVGWLLGWLALQTGGLLAPAAAHFVINAVGLLTIPRRNLPGHEV